MDLNPKLPQYFAKLQGAFEELQKNPNSKNLNQVKGDLKNIQKEMDNLHM